MRFLEVGWKSSEEDVQMSQSSERVGFYVVSGFGVQIQTMGTRVPTGGTSEKQHHIVGQPDKTCFLNDFLVLLILVDSV